MKSARLMAMVVLFVCANASTALSTSVTQPGETLGFAVGKPLAPGLYFINTANYGCRNTNPAHTCIGADFPILVWSTPWMIADARLQFVGSLPVAEVGIDHAFYQYGPYNPFLAGQLAWNLGNNWGFSYVLGVHFDRVSDVAWSSTSINQYFALSYTGNGWNLTGTLVWGTQFNHVTSRAQLSPCPPPFQLKGCNPDALNLDLTATKKFGKLELGVVGFGSTDLTQPIEIYAKQSQIALGGLIGYHFGAIDIQGFLTRDVRERNYGGYDTRMWTRIVVKFNEMGDSAEPPPRKR